MNRPIRTLVFSTLFPSAVRPGHGIFVETRLRELLRTGQVESRVIAPVPWFFSTNPRFGQYSLMASTPNRETYHGIDVLHPRYFLPPRVGMTIAPLSLALGAAGAVKRLLDEGFDFDLIDAHYYYPDGVAAALLAKWFGKPYVVTARGSDLNLIARYRLPRQMIQWAARNAAASIGVSAALTGVLREWGLESGRLHVMRNGVDLDRFTPHPQIETRRELGLPGGLVLLSVGNLVELKGHHLAIDVLARILPRRPDAILVIVGEGEERHRLEQQVRDLQLEGHVRFAGVLPNAALARWYSAADALILASSREGWANVLLESMACGTPVVATRIGGTPEVVASDVAGRLVEKRDATQLAAAIESLLESRPDRARVRAYAERFSWQATSDAQVSLFRAVAGASHG